MPTLNMTMTARSSSRGSITRSIRNAPPRRALRAVKEGVAESVNGTKVKVRADCICVHSDTPNAVAVAQAVKTAVAEYLD